MEFRFLSAAAIGMALMAISPATDPARLAPPDVRLVGAHLYASETPIDRWGDPVRAEDVALEDLGTIRDLATDAATGTATLVVEVGGLWGWGSQDVAVGLDRLRTLRTASGEQRLVVDLSAQGAEPALL